MKKKIFIVAAVIFSSQVHAQDSTKSLNEVVVTATKSFIKQSQTGKVITVIGRDVLDRSMGKDLAQLLTEQASIVVNGAGSNAGKDKSLYLRGAKNDNTVILINGIGVADASGVTGAFDPRLIPLEQIERIEIVKGAQSTLYGSNAVAGVINIITRKGSGKPASIYANISAGSYRSFNTNIGVSGTMKNVSYDAGYVHRQSVGISEAKDTIGNKNFDKDGFNQNGLYANFDAGVTKQFHVKPFVRYQYFTGGYDDGAFADGNDKYRSSVLSAGSIVQYNFNKGSVTGQYEHDKTSRAYQSSWGSSPYDGISQTSEIYATYNLCKYLQILGGVDYRNLQSLDTNSTPKNPKTDMFSPYASVYIKDIDGFNFELGGRYNVHSRYGNNFCYSINPSYLIKNRVKLFVNIASAFRVPSLGELYGEWGSNPNLQPEISQTFEYGFQSSFKKIDLRATYFHRKIKDVITTDAAFNYINMDRQNDQGVEIESAVKLNKKITVKLFYVYVDGLVTTISGIKDTTYFNLLKRPRNSFGVTINYQVTSRLFMSSNYYYYGKRVDNYFDTNTYTGYLVNLSAYSMWNLYASFDILPKKLKVFADAKNLLNKDFYEVYGYNSQGFNITAGISCRF